MTKANVTMPIGSARLGSARLGSARLGSARLGSARLGLWYSAFLSWRESFFHKIYNGLLPETWRVYALASAFCVFREGGGTLLKC